MKLAMRYRITAFVLSCVLIFLGCAIGANAYKLPSGYVFSNSYKSGKYYTQLAAVQLTGNQRQDIVSIAVSQIGYHEGSKGVFSGNGTGSANYTEYNRYAYSSENAAWCGSFVSWCAAMAGIPTTILPKTAGAKPVYWKMVGSGKLEGATAKTPENLVTNGGTYIPQIGDLVFFGSKSTGNPANNSCSHVGLIIEVNLTYSGNKVTQIEVITAEGNYSDKVSRNRYVFNSEKTNGLAYGSTYLNTFGVPNYAEKAEPEYEAIDIGAYGGTYLRTTTPVCDAVRKLQQGLNLISVLDNTISLPILTVDGRFDSNTLASVNAFQKSQALTVDGVVGSDTWNALRSRVIGLTKAYENDYIVSGNKLYAYKGASVSPALPGDITTIGEDAFRYRTGIVSVTFPKGLERIEDGAFSASVSLKNVLYPGTATEYASVNVMGGNSALKAAEAIYKMVDVTFSLEGVETTITIENGSTPVIPEQIIPQKQGNAFYEYVFDGWMMNGVLYEQLPTVDADATFAAEFIELKRILNVESLNNLLTVLAGGSDEIVLYDYTQDGMLNVDDINALLILLANLEQ